MTGMLKTQLIVTTLALLFATPSFAQDGDGMGQTAIPSKGLLWGSKMTLETQPCCAAPNGKLPDKAEAAMLSKLAGHAFRDDTILRLEIEGGRNLKITDCADETACEADRFRSHRLVGWWPALRYYVVNVPLFEASTAFLISEKDGRTTQVASPPILSPSGQHAVALQSDLMNGMTLQVIDLTATPPKVTEVSDMPTCKGFGPDSFLRPTPVWADDSHVRFDGVSPQPGDNATNKQLLKITGAKPAWEC
jgi:hypothetical protein